MGGSFRYGAGERARASEQISARKSLSESVRGRPRMLGANVNGFRTEMPASV
jgi:hypothetical protein